MSNADTYQGSYCGTTMLMECQHPLFGECSSSIITDILGTISLLSPGNTLTIAIVTNINPEGQLQLSKPKNPACFSYGSTL
jgi:hypothetical protein